MYEELTARVLEWRRKAEADKQREQEIRWCVQNGYTEAKARALSDSERKAILQVFAARHKSGKP